MRGQCLKRTITSLGRGRKILETLETIEFKNSLRNIECQMNSRNLSPGCCHQGSGVVILNTTSQCQDQQEKKLSI